MKTKMTTVIGLVALGMIGFTSNNATAANNLMSSFTTVETEENLTLEGWMPDSNLWAEKSDTKAEKAEKPLELTEGMTDEDFFTAAESYTASGSDREIEKYAIKQIEKSTAKVETENHPEANNNFFNDAESYTASGSEKEIEKYADKQVALEK